MKNGQFTKFELALKEALELIREDMKKHEGISTFQFHVSASGRVDGDLYVSFSMNNNYTGADVNVTGGNLQAVVIEYLRRYDWNKWNETLCLPNVSEAVEGAVTGRIDDEIPF